MYGEVVASAQLVAAQQFEANCAAKRDCLQKDLTSSKRLFWKDAKAPTSPANGLLCHEGVWTSGQ
eukprot:2107074-Amphidinium_carterae.1